MSIGTWAVDLKDVYHRKSGRGRMLAAWYCFQSECSLNVLLILGLTFSPKDESSRLQFVYFKDLPNLLGLKCSDRIALKRLN